MHFKTNYTSWKDPNTNEFITRNEYGKLGKRAKVNGISTLKYLTSLGYFKDDYNYYKLRDKLFLKNSEIIQDLKVVTIWLQNLRNEQDLKQAIEKIDGVIKILESIN